MAEFAVSPATGVATATSPAAEAPEADAPSRPTPLRYPSVSVIIPARDAAGAIGAALDSVLAQEYPGEVEVVVADGSATPDMAEAIRRDWPSVRVTPNPERVTPAGLNHAIRASRGEIVVRCDAHATLAPGYLRRAVETLRRTGAAHVGGRQRPTGVTPFERAVAHALLTPLGSGNAAYRAGGDEGPVDTVYLGAWRRETLEAAGGFDAALLRNQDYELNWRLRQRGGTVWFDPELSAGYRPRGGLRDLARQYFQYGRWKAAVLLRHPASLRPRQLAAPLLLLALAASIAAGLALFPPAAAALPLAYLLTLAGVAIAVALRRRDGAAMLMPLALATMHLCWGAGFLWPARRRRRG